MSGVVCRFGELGGAILAHIGMSNGRNSSISCCLELIRGGNLFRFAMINIGIFGTLIICRGIEYNPIIFDNIMHEVGLGRLVICADPDSSGDMVRGVTGRGVGWSRIFLVHGLVFGGIGLPIPALFGVSEEWVACGE
jgi:hypothetical protein